MATAENYQSSISNYQLRKAHWGLGVLAGSRFYPTSGVSLIALYRYYSPYFDNALGYAFSETSRLGDENGGYLGFEITRLKNWRFWGYGDVFYFSGPKYGIPQYPSLGYDALFEMQYHKPLNAKLSTLNYSLRLRAKEKGGKATYSTRAWFDYRNNGWSLRTNIDANLVNQSSISNNQLPFTYGISIFQDVSYSLPLREGRGLGFRLRLQWFDAREWDNRIYCYEYDVLYAYSIPAVYGLGGRAYLCLRWQIIPQLTLYFRASETIYARDWYIQKNPSFQGGAGGRLPTRTDLHLLLRAKL